MTKKATTPKRHASPRQLADKMQDLTGRVRALVEKPEDEGPREETPEVEDAEPKLDSAHISTGLQALPH